MIEATVGARITVRDEPINRDNAFWAPLIGRSGIIGGIGPDGLFDVSIDGDVVVEGVKRERVCVFAASVFEGGPRIAVDCTPRTVVATSVRQPWWKRLWSRR